MISKCYIGDGLSAIDHGFQIELYTGPEGAKESHVYLDNSVLRGLFRFVEISRRVVIVVQEDKKARERDEFPDSSGECIPSSNH